MDNSETVSRQDELEQESSESSESDVSLEELDIPADLKAELLRELEGFKEGDDGRRRTERPSGRG
jgi:hypothetical protein